MSAGYENAPITQTVSLFVFVLSTALKASSTSLDLFGLLQGQLWRLITSFFVFQNAAQTIVGLILLYTCRQFERQMGSKKFGAFLVFSYLISTLLGLALTVAASSIGFYLIPSSGPFPLIFALMTYYFWHIPKLHATQYSFAGLDLSEKSWIYLLGLQLMFSDGVPSIAAASTGLLAGYLYETDGFGLQNWRLPRFVERIFESISGFVGALIPTPAPVATRPGARAVPAGGVNNGTRHNLMMGDSPRGGGGGFFNDLQQFQAANPHGDFPALRTPVPIPPPSEEDITTLMSMGFEREAVVQALRAAGNNVEAAANSLLR